MRSLFFIGSMLLTMSNAYGDSLFTTKVSRPGEDILTFSDDGRSASIRVLARNEDTGGRFSAAEHFMPAGYDGRGFHVHHGIVQAIYVVSGSVTVKLIERCKSRTITLSEGSFLSIAPEVHHTFHTEFGVKLLAIDAPGDLIPMFEAMAGIDRTQSKKQQEQELSEIRKKRYDNDFTAAICEQDL